MAGKTEVSFPSLRLTSRQAQKVQKNKTARGKTHSCSFRVWGGFWWATSFFVTVEQVTLGNWVSLFAEGSGLGLYTWQQISIDIWLVLIWAIYSGIICVFLTCCEDSHCQMPCDGCRMQCIPQSLLRGHKPHIICGEEGSREKWSNN